MCSHLSKEKNPPLEEEKGQSPEKDVWAPQVIPPKLGNRSVLEFIAETAAEDALFTDAIFGEYAPGGSADLDAAEGELEVGEDG